MKSDKEIYLTSEELEEKLITGNKKIIIDKFHYTDTDSEGYRKCFYDKYDKNKKSHSSLQKTRKIATSGFSNK